jgi:nitrogen fixation NifU-like protein
MFDELRDLYQEMILDHGKNPRNHRHPEDANREACGNNPMCGDQLTVYLTLDDGGIIQDAAFEGTGCAISTASASMMTEIIKGRPEEEVRALFERFHLMCTSDDAIADGIDIDPRALTRLEMLSGVRQFPMRVKCATLAWHTMKAAMIGQNDEISTEN